MGAVPASQGKLGRNERPKLPAVEPSLNQVKKSYSHTGSSAGRRADAEAAKCVYLWSCK